VPAADRLHARPASNQAEVPVISLWILDTGQRGDLAQMVAVARQLSCADVRIIPLVDDGQASRLPHWPALRGASLAGVSSAARRQLCPPWPDVVFCAGRGAQAAARWVGRQAGGYTKLVNFLRPQAPLSWFDLVITMPPFRVPPAPNVLHLQAMLLADAENADDGARTWEERLNSLPRPWIAVLAGGGSPPYAFDEHDARRLADCMEARVTSSGGSLLLSTSPRTPPGAVRILQERAATLPHLAYVWGRSRGENPHQLFIRQADEIIVTMDSLSMMTEAAASNANRVMLFPLANANSMKQRLRGLASHLADTPALSAVGRALRSLGLLLPPQDKEGYAAMLVCAGYALFAPRNNCNEMAQDSDFVAPRRSLRPVVEAECRRAALAVEQLLARR